MARSVGNIEITVDLDTGRLQAQAKKTGHIVGEEFADAIEEELDHLEVNLAEIDGRREAQVARKQIEGILRGMEGLVDIDLTEARAALTEFREQQEAIDLVLNTDIELSPDDLAEIRADFRKTKEIIERNAIEVEMNLALDQAQVENERLRAQEQLDDMKIHAEMELALSEAILDAERFRIQQEADELEMQLALHMAVAEAEITRFREAQEANDIDLEVDVHEGKGFGGHWAMIAGAVLAFGENIGVALEGATAAATSVLSSAFQGIGAAAGAAAPLVASFGAAITAVIVGSQGFGDAMKEVNKQFAEATKLGKPLNEGLLMQSEAFRNLAPSAQEAAMMFGRVRDELGDFRTVIQEDLFSGMSQEINDLAETALPSLEEGLRVTAQSVNAFGKSLSDIAQRTDFEGMIKALDPALDDALDAALAFAGTLEPFLRAAAPAAERLAEMIERGAEALQKWTVLNPDKIATFLDDGLTSLERWTELLQSTGDLLVTIFDAGSESGDGFVVALNNIIERWDAFLNTAEGQDALTDFFDTGRAAMDALKPVLEGLKTAFADLVDADSIVNFQALGQAIGDALPALADVMALLADLQLGVAMGTLIEILGTFSAMLNALPDGVLEFAGAMLVAYKAASVMSPALDLVAVGARALAIQMTAGATSVAGLSVAMKALTSSTGVLLAVTAAITIAIAAWQLFGDDQNTAKARTEELTVALQNEVDALISSGDAASGAAAGFQALNSAIFDTGEGGEKVNAAFQLINDGAGDMQLGVQDSVDVLTGLKGEADATIPMLQKLGEGYGLSGEAAAGLAEIVANTDDNMKDAEIRTSELGLKMTELAEKTGIPREELVLLFGSLEELQDQAEDTNIDEMAAGFLSAASTMEGLEGEIWKTVDAMRANGEIADDNVVAYNTYVEMLNEAKNASDDASSSNEGLASSTILVQNAILDAIAAHEAEMTALAASRKEAMDKWRAEEKLGEATEDAASKILKSSYATDAARKSMSNATDDVIDLGEGMRDSADAADALSSALDLLLNPFLGVQEAASAVQENTDALTEALMGGADVMKLREEAAEAMMEGDQAAADQANFFAGVLAEQNKTLDLNTEAGRENAEAIRTSITGITDFATAQLAAGASTEEVTAAANASRDALIAQAAGFFTASESAGTAEQQATDYINALGLTPELINTVFSQPGLIDALLNAEDLTLLYDDAGNPVITEFEAAGIDPAMATAEGFKTLVESMNSVTGAPTVSAANIDPAAVAVEGVAEPLAVLGDTAVAPTIEVPSAEEATTAVEGVQEPLDTLDATNAVPSVAVPTADGVKTKVEGLQGQFDALDATSVSVPVSTPNLQVAIDKVNELDRAIDNLTTNKTVTITERTVQAGGMAGALITGPRSMNVGELGYTEALVPLELPLNRVNPSVRQFAEILRGGSSQGQISPGTGKVVNNYMTITPQSADPGAVATQVINRSVVMANRS